MIRSYFHKYLVQNRAYARRSKSTAIYGHRALHAGHFRAVQPRFGPVGLTNLEGVRYSSMSRHYFGEYLAQNRIYARWSKPEAIYECRALRGCHFCAV